MKPGVFSFTLLPVALLLLVSACNKTDGPPSPITDIEGNIYKSVRLGDQIWMAENLRTSTFADGTAIPGVADSIVWGSLETPGFCWYNNDETSNKDTYGALYNYYCVISGKLCPSGWHAPSRDEWQKLRDFLGDSLTDGGRLKEEGTKHWRTPNTGAVDDAGFTALPGGIRYFEGTFSSLSYYTAFWSSTEADIAKGWYFGLYYNDAMAEINRISKKNGFSVRCLKD